MRLVDRVLDGVEDMYDGLRGWSKSDHTQYYPLACPHNANILSLFNGSLLSVVRVKGYMGQYFPAAFSSLAKDWSQFLRYSGDSKTNSGFDLFWFHEFDPTGMGNEVQKSRSLMIAAGKRRGLNAEDILAEEADLYAKICAREESLLLVVTHLDSLPKTDQKRALVDRKRALGATAKGRTGMILKAGVSALEALHEQHVNKVTTFMRNVKGGYAIERLDTNNALKAMRFSLLPGQTSKAWSPRLKAQMGRFRATDEVKQSFKEAQQPSGKPNDWSFLLPPKLSDQMLGDAIDLGKYAVFGDRIYAPMYVSELASAPEHLESLLEMCYKRKIPIRLSYSLMANSSQANYWNRLFASLFTFMSASNRQINKADNALKAYSESGGRVLGYGLAATTWSTVSATYDAEGASHYDVAELQSKARDLETLLQQWGGQQIDTMFGCSIEATMSATAGYAIPPICPKAPQTEGDVVTQLPLMRPASLWDSELSMWFRTSDGVLMPYQPMSSLQNAMITLVSGGMGFGKSNCISEHLFYFANHPLAREMAYIRGLDFGASSRGVIDVIRASLPHDRQHEAFFESFRNDGSIVKNPFDTLPGLRAPLEDHTKYLMSFLSIICEQLLAKAGVANVMSILKTLIEEAYNDKNPKVRQSNPNKFEPLTADPLVVAALEEIEFQIERGCNDWDAADALLEYGIKNNKPHIIHAARIAQRRAVPKFKDLIQLTDKLADRFKNSLYEKDFPLTKAIAGCLSSAVNIFPCMSGVTNRDISESRVCVFDMSEVFGRGTTPYDDWQRSVFFAVAMRLQTEDLFVNLIETGEELKDKQPVYGFSDTVLRYHLEYLEAQSQVDKLFWADEVHRVGKVEGALSIIDSMGLEGRKYQVGILLGTQIPEHFPPGLLAMHSTFFVFGCSQSMEMAEELQKILTLSDDERDAIYKITPPTSEKGANVFAVFKTTEGVQRLLLHFQMGGLKRWAFATAPDERALRGILYRTGESSSWARRVLAKHVPDLKVAIKAKMEAAGGSSLSRQEAIQKIAAELLRRH